MLPAWEQEEGTIWRLHDYTGLSLSLSLSSGQIDFIAHDDQPYAHGDVDDIYRPFKETGRFVATQRTEGISTSDLIGRIVKDYDMYVRRNLARGYTARSLNVGFMKVCVCVRVCVSLCLWCYVCVTVQEKELQLRDKVSGLRHAWEERSRDLIGGFMGLFGRDGRLVSHTPCHAPRSVWLVRHPLPPPRASSFTTRKRR